MGKMKSGRVRVKRWGGGTKTDNMGKLLIKTLRESFDVPNGLEKLRNLRHCFQNDFSNKINYKYAKRYRNQFIWQIRFVSCPFKFTSNTKFREQHARLLLFKSITIKSRIPNQTSFEYVLVLCVKTHNISIISVL